MKHFRQSYGNQATRHLAERCWKWKGWLWAPLAFDAFEPFLTCYRALQYDKWVKAGLKHELCQVATAVLKPIERAMQPWIDGPRRTRRTQRTRRTRRTPAMLDACFRASLLGFGAARRFGMWRCCDTQERGVRSQHIHGGWQSDRCLSGTLVSKQSVAHIRPGTPWHMQVSKLVVSQGFMQGMDWIWCLQFLACRIVMPWSHPRRNESDDRRRGRRRRPSCLHRRWEDDGYLMQHVAASSGTAVWTTHPNQSNIATAEIGRPNNIKLNYQLICKVFQCVVADPLDTF